MIYLTEDEIVDNFVSDLLILNEHGEKNIELLKNIPKEYMSQFHHTAGMNIRNRYGLWNHECPLTKDWHELRESGSTEYIVDNIDEHPHHPDAVSMNILYKIWDKINESS